MKEIYVRLLVIIVKRQELGLLYPLDGKGIKNENVTDFRYALVESDVMDLGRQKAIIEELELPVACLVYSAGEKSPRYSEN